MKISEVKAGDIVLRYFGYSGEELCVVDKVTPTQIVIEDMQFDRETGKRRGDTGYYSSWIDIPTTDDADRVLKGACIRALLNLSDKHLNTLSLQTLMDISLQIVNPDRLHRINDLAAICTKLNQTK